MAEKFTKNGFEITPDLAAKNINYANDYCYDLTGKFIEAEPNSKYLIGVGQDENNALGYSQSTWGKAEESKFSITSRTTGNKVSLKLVRVDHGTIPQKTESTQVEQLDKFKIFGYDTQHDWDGILLKYENSQIWYKIIYHNNDSNANKTWSDWNSLFGNFQPGIFFALTGGGGGGSVGSYYSNTYCSGSGGAGGGTIIGYIDLEYIFTNGINIPSSSKEKRKPEYIFIYIGGGGNRGTAAEDRKAFGQEGTGAEAGDISFISICFEDIFTNDTIRKISTASQALSQFLTEETFGGHIIAISGGQSGRTQTIPRKSEPGNNRRNDNSVAEYIKMYTPNIIEESSLLSKMAESGDTINTTNIQNYINPLGIQIFSIDAGMSGGQGAILYNDITWKQEQDSHNGDSYYYKTDTPVYKWINLDFSNQNIYWSNSPEPAENKKGNFDWSANKYRHYWGMGGWRWPAEKVSKDISGGGGGASMFSYNEFKSAEELIGEDANHSCPQIPQGWGGGGCGGIYGVYDSKTEGTDKENFGKSGANGCFAIFKTYPSTSQIISQLKKE